MATARKSRRNFLGFGRKMTHSPKLMQEAFDAGKRSGDTAQFKSWLAKQGDDIHGSFKRRLEKRYRAGVESLWHEEAKEAKQEAAKVKRETVKREKEQEAEVVTDVTLALAGMGMNRTEAKSKAKRAYREGDSFDTLFRKVMKKNPSPEYARYFRLQKKAAAADERFQRALEVAYGSRAGDIRYQTSKQTPKIRALGLAKQKADAAASAALAVARKNPAKFDRCVADVTKSLKKAKRPGNAYAICSAAGTRNPGMRLVDSFSTRSTAQSVAKNYRGSKIQKRGGKFEVWAKTGRKRNYESMVWSGKQGGATAEVYKVKDGYEVEFSNGTMMHAKSLGGATSIARVKLHELARNPDDTSVTALVPGASYIDAWGKAGERVYKGVRRSASGLLKKAKGRKNPIDQATVVYEEFHGKPASEILEITDKRHIHTVTVSLGPLVALDVILPSGNKRTQLIAPGFKWNPSGKGSWEFDDSTPLTKRVMLTASEDRKQLFFNGGDQSIPDTVLKSWGFTERDWHDSMVLGLVQQVTYRTEKKFDKFIPTDYYHKHGGEGSKGSLPTLLYFPRDQHIEVAGGRYYIAPLDRGLGASPGIVG